MKEKRRSILQKSFSEQPQLICSPIGTFHALEGERYLLPRQPGLAAGTAGKIELLPGHNFTQALEELEGFDKIWLLFWFHRNEGWKPKVMPPRGEKKRGLFATRSPHRPNPIGLSCVTLKKIEGLTLQIEDHDLLDGTPILDIKPYLSYSDVYPDARQGWLEELPPEADPPIVWEAQALAQARWVEEHQHPHFVEQVAGLIGNNQYRVKEIAPGLYEKAFKTWRIDYKLGEGEGRIIEVRSGYDAATLSGEKSSRWDDVAIHLEFLKQSW
jgi:tRNA (adenine37-N6)-methyltransferase